MIIKKLSEDLLNELTGENKVFTLAIDYQVDPETGETRKIKSQLIFSLETGNYCLELPEQELKATLKGINLAIALLTGKLQPNMPIEKLQEDEQDPPDDIPF